MYVYSVLPRTGRPMVNEHCLQFEVTGYISLNKTVSLSFESEARQRLASPFQLWTSIRGHLLPNTAVLSSLKPVV